MKFRIKHIENLGYFGQVKGGIFSKWKTIGKHPNGYGLYPNDHEEYPLVSDDAAVQRCNDYKKWFNQKSQSTHYFNI